MAYNDAERCFSENLKNITTTPSDELMRVMYNINEGLLSLTRAIEDDMDRTSQTLRDIQNKMLRIGN